MEQHIINKRTGLKYELQGDYYLIAGEDETECSPIGIWGQRHLRWLKHNRRLSYTNLLTTGRLYDYLQEIDTQATEQLELLIPQMAKAEGVSEQMKAENQMEWVKRMNDMRNQAEEIINSVMICC